MGVRIVSEMKNAENTLGTVQGILTAMDTKVRQDDIARIFYSYASKSFDAEVRRRALAAPDLYGHMYDWNLVGRPTGKLWGNMLQGGLGRRAVTFTFLPSVRNVPATTPENTGISPQDFPKLRKNGQYKFPNKAMVFESGQTTVIKPRPGRALFIPLQHKTRSGMKQVNYRGELTDRDKRRGFVWVRRPVEQEHNKSRGKFTALFLEFYATRSHSIFIEKVEPRVSRSIRKVYTSRMPNLGGGRNTVTLSSTARTKAFDIRAVANASQIASADVQREMKRLIAEAERFSDL